jgi:hypothetical protein
MGLIRKGNHHRADEKTNGEINLSTLYRIQEQEKEFKRDSSSSEQRDTE